MTEAGARASDGYGGPEGTVRDSQPVQDRRRGIRDDRMTEARCGRAGSTPPTAEAKTAPWASPCDGVGMTSSEGKGRGSVSLPCWTPWSGADARGPGRFSGPRPAMPSVADTAVGRRAWRARQRPRWRRMARRRPAGCLRRVPGSRIAPLARMTHASANVIPLRGPSTVIAWPIVL